MLCWRKNWSIYMGFNSAFKGLSEYRFNYNVHSEVSSRNGRWTLDITQVFIVWLRSVGKNWTLSYNKELYHFVLFRTYSNRSNKFWRGSHQFGASFDIGPSFSCMQTEGFENPIKVIQTLKSFNASLWQIPVMV